MIAPVVQRENNKVRPGPLQSPAEMVAPQGRREPRFSVRDYAILLKPRVMSLVVFTGVVGLVLAPAAIEWLTAVIAVCCIGVGAGAAGAINMWYDRDIDRVMQRTMNRPLPAGRLDARVALALGLALGLGSVAMMAAAVNSVAAALLALTICYYIFVYTMWLKRRTPQNVVIGGASGALPPVIGWAAATGDIGWGAVSLFLIIFLWTPPHSWALALFRTQDYATAGVPMLPVVAGDRCTRNHILAYTLLLLPATLLPLVVGMAGVLYGAVAVVLGGWLLRHAIKLRRDGTPPVARAMFFFTILYLFLIFVALLADRAVGGLGLV